jgi:hypothetical protein
MFVPDLTSCKKMSFFKNISTLFSSAYVLEMAFFLAFGAPFGYDSSIIRE